ncbi:hypothetical protein C9980_11355 [Vibrio mediterranei]|uniref:hypothetical protein n=1 Tax=Vibrio mediterranei TaxID=689 RepID=UPI000D1863AA|nr:hypothetical protein [Vibrio mediterranei]MCG9663290.1 hypothetical protein [Vibrio mediterranei]PTC04784.1 hypothetical protein C9980_11355 [Vibrio mediterranei]
MNVLRSLSCFAFLLTASTLLGCGGSSPTNPEATLTQPQSMIVRTFDFIVSPIDSIETDVIATSLNGEKHELLKDQYSRRIGYSKIVQFRDTADFVDLLNIELISQNEQRALANTQIKLVDKARYWVFSLGNTDTDDYQLLALHQPKVQPVDGTVPVFILDLDVHKHIDKTAVHIGQQSPPIDISSLGDFKQINMSKDLMNFDLTVNYSDTTTLDCTVWTPEEDSVWNDNAWVVFIVNERCHLRHVDQ